MFIKNNKSNILTSDLRASRHATRENDRFECWTDFCIGSFRPHSFRPLHLKKLSSFDERILFGGKICFRSVKITFRYYYYADERKLNSFSKFARLPVFNDSSRRIDERTIDRRRVFMKESYGTCHFPRDKSSFSLLRSYCPSSVE